MTINTTVFRKMNNEDKDIVLNRIYRHLCKWAGEGFSITASERIVSKELRISYSIISSVSSTRKFKDYCDRLRM